MVWCAPPAPRGVDICNLRDVLLIIALMIDQLKLYAIHICSCTHARQSNYTYGQTMPFSIFAQ